MPVQFSYFPQLNSFKQAANVSGLIPVFSGTGSYAVSSQPMVINFSGLRINALIEMKKVTHPVTVVVNEYIAKCCNDFSSDFTQSKVNKDLASKSRRVALLLANAGREAGVRFASFETISVSALIPFISDDNAVTVEKLVQIVASEFESECEKTGTSINLQVLRNLKTAARKIFVFYVTNYQPVEVTNYLTTTGGKKEIRAAQNTNRAIVKTLSGEDFKNALHMWRREASLSFVEWTTRIQKLAEKETDAATKQLLADFPKHQLSGWAGSGRRGPNLPSKRFLPAVVAAEAVLRERLTELNDERAQQLPQGFLYKLANFSGYRTGCDMTFEEASARLEALAEKRPLVTHVFKKGDLGNWSLGDDVSHPVWTDLRRYCELKRVSWKRKEPNRNKAGKIHSSPRLYGGIGLFDNDMSFYVSSHLYAGTVQRFMRFVSNPSLVAHHCPGLESVKIQNLSLYLMAIPELARGYIQFCQFKKTALESFTACISEFFCERGIGSISTVTLFVDNEQQNPPSVVHSYLLGRSVKTCVEETLKHLKALKSAQSFKSQLKPEASKQLIKMRGFYLSFPASCEISDYYIEIDDKIFSHFDSCENYSRSFLHHHTTVRHAFATALLRSTALRAEDVSSLQFSDVPTTKVGTLYFDSEKKCYVVPAAPTKNGNIMHVQLLPIFNEIAEYYLSVSRPYLMGGKNNPYLFPNGHETGYRKIHDDIPKCLGLIRGVSLTAHNFRHLVGFIYVNRYQSAKAAAILGDTEATVLSSYSIKSLQSAAEFCADSCTTQTPRRSAVGPVTNHQLQV